MDLYSEEKEPAELDHIDPNDAVTAQAKLTAAQTPARTIIHNGFHA